MARSRGVVAAVVTGVLVLGGAGYAAADAYDLVPGVLTVEPVPPPPEPFPTAPAAVPAPEVTPVLDHLDAAAPVPDAAEVTALAEAAIGHEWMGDSVGVVVADQLTGEVLTDLDGDRPREPASTAKLLTAVAAMTALGPDTTLETTVVSEPSGRLVLVGGGDVMLDGGAGDPEATNGRAGLVDLAAQVVRQLRLAGVEEVRLDVDDTLFSGPAIAPGWVPGDLNNGFVAPVAPLAVNIAKTRDEPYPPRHPDPALTTGRQLAALLADRGITVTGQVGRRTAPEDGTPIGSVSSAPVRDIVRYALQVSDNTVTEVLGRLVAVERGLPGSFQGATRAVLAEVATQGVDTSAAVLADCSGLAEGSVLSAGMLVELLLLAGDAEHTELLPVAVDIPVSGWQGTLADRFDEGPARGLVRAKTGSLSGVTSLAGTLLTQDGRQLVFAVLADDTPPGGQLGPRRVIDAFVQQLVGCECGLP